jgi:DNA polymerase-3 subunit epsilon
MPKSAHRTINISLIWAAVLIVLGGALVTPVLFTFEAVSLTVRILVLWAMLVALAMIARSVIIVREIGKGTEWLRTAVLNVVADRKAVMPELPANFRAPEIVTLLQALGRYQNQVTRERLAPDRRLVAVLGSLASGVVVTTEKGQVSLLNNSARELLGSQRAKVGTSLFAALSPESFARALARAQKAGRPIEQVFERLDGVDLQGRISALPDGEGAIILFPPMELEQHRPGVDFDLELHDVPPAVQPLTLDTPLEELPALILDTETTGLQAATDRVISLGAVCAHGPRMFRGHMIDDLVNPGVPIPPVSTAIHGITDDMVQGARGWPETYAELQRMARNRVIVGHGIPFDLTIMQRECERHDLAWEEPVFIDTLRLASLLNPTLKDLGLEKLAELYQIDLRGRHTALGDALVTAELFFRMMPRLQMQGFKTLEDLLRFHCNEAVDVIAKQKEAGWVTSQPQYLREQAGPH